MKFKNLRIGSQLIIGFSTLLVFVLVMSIASYLQTNKMHQQVNLIYNHPYTVRKAIDNLHIAILQIRVSDRDLLLATNEAEKQEAIQLLNSATQDVPVQFGILKERYLGSQTSVDEAKDAFDKWQIAREENIKLAQSGKLPEAISQILPHGSVGTYRINLLAKIKVLDDFALNKAIEINNTSESLDKSILIEMTILVSAIFVLSFLIISILIRNIRKPLAELDSATKRFHAGDANARSSYESKNEFGILSLSFNALAETIQSTTETTKKTLSISNVMTKEDNAKDFFQNTLASLAQNTSSTIAAIYLLSEDKNKFEHCASLGLDENAKQSFSASRLEGEFGAVISSEKTQHIKNIPKNTQFIFNTVSGKFIPNEIITIPIHDTKNLIAIISLASINSYSEQTLKLIDAILPTMSARINGILTHQKNKENAIQLQLQYMKLDKQQENLSSSNKELEAQKTELHSQSLELIEQNTELEMQKKQLHEASRLKTNFLSNMSHELRTPLNSVIALSGVLNRRLIKQIPAEEYGYLEVIERNGKHLLHLINDILDISRIESGREEVEITKFNVNALLDDVINMILPQAKQRSITLVHLESDNDLETFNDANKFRHVVQNLIGNAVKFTEKGKVEIKSWKDENNIFVNVKDSGIGIAEEHLVRIFDEFRQADGGTSRKFGGPGLGLSIARKYANLLGGNVTVKSELGKGSEFTFTLPIIYAEENSISEEKEIASFNLETKPSPQKSNNDSLVKTVLIVEDSEPVIIQMKDILGSSGYKIIVARNGAEALETISHTIPDAMVLDLMMPGVDGFEVLEQLRAADQTAHISVLILTAKHITKEELHFLKRNNIHQLIQKGDVNRLQLLEAIHKMIYPNQTETNAAKRESQKIEGKPVVLVVEDNADNMITVRALLSEKFILIEAVNGYEGIELAKKHIPNLILMDIALPGIDGVETFKVIRNDPRLMHIPIIALTASAMIHDRETILSHGFDIYIPKPIDEKIFFKTINEVLYGK